MTASAPAPAALLRLARGASMVALAWMLLKRTIGLRLSKAEEVLGLDKVELGILAYPEFRVAQRM